MSVAESIDGCISFSLSILNSHFPGEPGLAGVFIEAKDDGGGGDNWTTVAISRAKLQSNHHHQDGGACMEVPARCSPSLSG